LKSKEEKLTVTAEDIRGLLEEFCSDANTLVRFYEEELALLGSVPEDPPPLSI
jgi:hypothetical protein